MSQPYQGMSHRNPFGTCPIPIGTFHVQNTTDMSQPYRGMSYRTPHWYMSHTDWNILIEEYHGQVPIGSGHVPIRLIKHLIITYPTRIETYSANNSGKALLFRGVLDLYIYIYIYYIGIHRCQGSLIWHMS